jgi:hypothetical protein
MVTLFQPTFIRLLTPGKLQPQARQALDRGLRVAPQGLAVGAGDLGSQDFPISPTLKRLMQMDSAPIRQ